MDLWRLIVHVFFMLAVRRLSTHLLFIGGLKWIIDLFGEHYLWDGSRTANHLTASYTCCDYH